MQAVFSKFCYLTVQFVVLTVLAQNWVTGIRKRGFLGTLFVEVRTLSGMSCSSTVECFVLAFVFSFFCLHSAFCHLSLVSFSIFLIWLWTLDQKLFRDIPCFQEKVIHLKRSLLSVLLGLKMGWKTSMARGLGEWSCMEMMQNQYLLCLLPA